MPAQAQRPRRAWLQTHWKVALPVCLGLGVSAILFALFLMSNSDVAKLAMSEAQASSKMTERLGQPLKRGWFVSGNIEVTPASGHAELAIPVSGPKGSGTLYAEARKQAGLWHLNLLQFGSEGSTERLDLLPTDMTPAPAPSPQ